MFHHILDSLISRNGHEEVKKIKGRVILMKKNVLDFNDFGASLFDGIDELIGNKVSLQLISSVNTYTTAHAENNKLKGKVGKEAYLREWNAKIPSLTAHDSAFEVDFEYEEEIGLPGAFIINNFHHTEFYLKTLTLEHVPGHGPVHFVCNSWIYPDKRYKNARIFFTNQAYLPGKTPEPLVPYRQEELVNLQGDGTGQLEEWDRVYDYAYYNDLGNPDKDADHARPVLGGSSQYPYPRRGRTGRPPTETDPNSESPLPVLMSLNVYVPRDERFGHLKMADFLGYNLKSISQILIPTFTNLCKSSTNEFDSFDDVHQLYKGGFKLPESPANDDKFHSHLLKQVFPVDGEGLFKFPLPEVIEGDKYAWRTDEEFAREMLAGINPMIIRRLEDFPPTSNLDPELYGDQTSTITEHHVQNQLEGLTVDEALNANRLFILNHHDALMPYIRRINTTTTKMYATRTLLFLRSDGRLKPVVIELSIPHPDGDEFGSISKVYTPAEKGIEGSIWLLAKAYVAVNDSGVHELISH